MLKSYPLWLMLARNYLKLLVGSSVGCILFLYQRSVINMKIFKIAGGVVLSVMASGCLMVPVPTALITNVQYPHEQTVVTGDIGGKQGESGITTFLFFGSFGDATVKTAARKAGITQVKTISHRYSTVFGVIQKYSTIVTGD